MRVSFRDVRERFAQPHAVVRSMRASGVELELQLGLYPWWEHPRLPELLATGRPWRLGIDPRDAPDVWIHAHGVETISTQSRLQGRVIDELSFLEKHALLWATEPRWRVACPQPLDTAVADRLLRAVHDAAGSSATPLAYFSNPDSDAWRSLVSRAPAVLGELPASLAELVTSILELARVPYTTTAVATGPSREPCVALLMDRRDYVVAQDFELELPERFEHRDAWLLVD